MLRCGVEVCWPVALERDLEVEDEGGAMFQRGRQVRAEVGGDWLRLPLTSCTIEPVSVPCQSHKR